MKRVIVEIGPGRGDFLFHLALENPEALIIGIEIKRRRTVQLLRRIERKALTNIVLLHADAREAVPLLFSERSIDTMYIHFPDPWPKRRHAHYRLMTSRFIRACAASLKDGGFLSFATDVADYAEATDRAIQHVGLMRHALFPLFPSLFAKKWQGEDKTIHHFCYQRPVSNDEARIRASRMLDSSVSGS